MGGAAVRGGGAVGEDADFYCGNGADYGLGDFWAVAAVDDGAGEVEK